MNALDVALVVILLVACVLGYYRGFFRELLSLVAWIGGGLGAALFACRLAPRLAEALTLPVAITEALGGVAIFLLVYVSCRVLGWGLARLTEKVLPSSFERTSGVLLAIGKTVCACTVVLLVFDSRRGMPAVSERIPDSAIGSRLVSHGWEVIASVRAELGMDEPAGEEGKGAINRVLAKPRKRSRLPGHEKNEP